MGLTKVGGCVEGGLLHELVTAEMRTVAGLKFLVICPGTFSTATSSDLGRGAAGNVSKHLGVVSGILLMPLG